LCANPSVAGKRARPMQGRWNSGEEVSDRASAAGRAPAGASP
jgi:hypothetical protein